MKMHIEVVISTDETNLVPEEEWADEIKDLFYGWDVDILKLEKVE